MKKLAIAACAMVMALGLIACSGGTSNEPTEDGAENTEATATEEAADATAEAEPEAATKPEAATEPEAEPEAETEPESTFAPEPASPVDSVDVSTVDVDVSAMGDEEAFAYMDEFANRTPDELDADEGLVMHITGQVSRNTKVEDDGDHVSCSVGIKGEGGTIKGVNFYVIGWTAEDYPENKAQVEVTGVWGKVDGYGTNAGRTLICNAEDVHIL